MAVLLSLLAAFSYALQSSLMVHYYRRIDRLSAISYRGLSFGISMSPLLFFIPRETLTNIPLSLLLALIPASGLTLISGWSAASCYNYLPVGISMAVLSTGMSIASLLIAWFFMDEVLSANQVFLIALLLTSVAALALCKNSENLKIKADSYRGAICAAIFGISLGLAYCMVGLMSRSHHPLLVGFIWEFGVGIIGLLALFIRGLILKNPLEKVSSKDFLTIVLYSSPTVIGTACVTYAATLAPIGVVTAVLSVMIVAGTILSRFLHGEVMSWKQWVLIVVVCLNIALLKANVPG